jgi:hypothetical protein
VRHFSKAKGKLRYFKCTSFTILPFNQSNRTLESISFLR